MEVDVDRERCIGSGMCVLTAPDLFDQDEEDGRVLLVLADLPAQEWVDAAMRAVVLCPSGALSLRDSAPAE